MIYTRYDELPIFPQRVIAALGALEATEEATL